MSRLLFFLRNIKGIHYDYKLKYIKVLVSIIIHFMLQLCKMHYITQFDYPITLNYIYVLAQIAVCETAEALYRHVPMELLPEEYLPDDYTGPNAGSTKDLIGLTNMLLS